MLFTPELVYKSPDLQGRLRTWPIIVSRINFSNGPSRCPYSFLDCGEGSSLNRVWLVVYSCSRARERSENNSSNSSHCLCKAVLNLLIKFWSLSSWVCSAFMVKKKSEESVPGCTRTPEIEKSTKSCCQQTLRLIKVIRLTNESLFSAGVTCLHLHFFTSRTFYQNLETKKNIHFHN